MIFPPDVERWRATVARYFPPELIEKALWTIMYESGGNPGAVGDGGAARGLFQIQDSRSFSSRPDAAYLDNPENNIAYAAKQLGAAGGDFSAWGENNLYQGQVFGALGNNPFPGSTAAVASAPQPYFDGSVWRDPATGRYWSDSANAWVATNGRASVGDDIQFTGAGGGTYQMGDEDGVSVDANGNIVIGGGGGGVETIETDPVTGRRYRARDGVWQSWMDPAPSSGSTAPASYTQQTDTDGSVTGTPGAIYQRASNGAVTVIYRPAATSTGVDPDGDGYDNETGLPVGVTKVNTSVSPTGLVYRGIPVKADGSPYQAKPEGPNTDDYKYFTDPVSGAYSYFDPATGKTIAISGAKSGPGSTPANAYNSGVSSSGGVRTIAPQSVGLGSFGGSGAEAMTPYQQAQLAAAEAARREAALERDADRAFDREQRDIDRAIRAAEQAAGLAEAYENRKRQLTLDFQNSVSSTDPSALAAFTYANGDYSDAGGGNIGNALAGGGTAVSDNLNQASAQFLRQLRAGPTPYSGYTPSPGGGLPSGPGGGATPPPASAPGTTTSPVPGAAPTSNVGQPIPYRPGYVYGPDGRPVRPAPPALTPYQLDAQAQFDQYRARAEMQKWYSSLDPMDAARYTARGDGSGYDLTGSFAEPETDWNSVYGGLTIGPGGAGSTTMGTASNYNRMMEQDAQQRENRAYLDSLNVVSPPDPLAIGGIARDTAVDQTTGQLPKYAGGGLARGAFIVGDSPSGKPTGNEEMVIAPGGARVIPLNRGRAKGLMSRMPRYALGTAQGYTWSPYATYEDTTDVGMQGNYTPAASYSYVKPVPQPAPVQPAAQPVAQPMAQPVAPAQPVAATPVAQQPAAAQPAGQQPGLSSATAGLTQPPAISPEDQALADEIARFRAGGFQYPQLNPMDVGYTNILPTVRDTYERGLRAQKGIPLEDQAFERARYGLRGASRGAVGIGY